MNPIPPPQPFNPEEIDRTWTDEQKIALVHSYTPETRLPTNVLADFDPFPLSPDDLPEGTWYLVDYTIARASSFGYWERDIALRRIDSYPMGWTITWAYFKYRNNERTTWLLQEYMTAIACKKLCRIFQGPEPEPEPAPVIPVAGDEPNNPILLDGRDFLELNDLEIPPSPPSSCITSEDLDPQDGIEWESNELPDDEEGRSASGED